MTTNNQTTDQAIRKIRFLLQKELDKYDRVEIETELGVTDFMPVYLVLEKLAPVVANEVRKAETRARIDGIYSMHDSIMQHELKWPDVKEDAWLNATIHRWIDRQVDKLKGVTTNE